MVQRQKMRARQVRHMNIVPDTAPVRRVIIRTKHLDIRPLAAGRIQHQGNQVSFRIVAFPDFSVRIGSCSIEIPEHDKLQTVSGMIILEDTLHHQLGRTVRIDRMLRHILRQRQSLRFPIDGTGGRENDFITAILTHYLQQIQRIAHIVVIIFLGILHGFPDISKRGKMKHRFYVMIAKYRLQVIGIRQIALYERPPFHCFPMTINQTVKDNRLIAFLMKRFIDMGTDIPGPAANKNCH